MVEIAAFAQANPWPTDWSHTVELRTWSTLPKAKIPWWTLSPLTMWCIAGGCLVIAFRGCL